MPDSRCPDPAGSRLRRWAVPGVPFAVSLLLSLATLGSSLGWQDSGFFLAAVHEGALLYPPGFILWHALCRAWVAVLGFLPFTLAVHSFSAVCAALAAAAVALAARALLAARGPLLRTGEPGPADDAAAAVAGCLAATGYTFWASALLAKVYALAFLAVAALLWRMIVAAESGRPRDLTLVAALIGLAWAAHPSATTLGPVLVLFVAVHARALGARGVAGRTALAAACALGPSIAGLPLLAARESPAAFGRPQGVGELAAYLAGLRFVGAEDAFVVEPSRLLSVLRYFAEEFLVVGGLAALAGTVLVARANRRLAVGLAAWTLPVLLVTVLFAREGQHDFWFVLAWLPLHVAGALALRRLPPLGAAAAGLAGVLSAAAVNWTDLDQRGNALPETYARLHLAPLEKDAILVLGSDDAVGGALYLQAVRGERPDVLVVRWALLEDGTSGRPSWYDHALARRRSDVVVPDYAGMRAKHGQAPGVSLAAFANANLRSGRPVYFEPRPDERLLRPDAALAPSGAFWRMTPKGEARIREEDWAFPLEPEQVVKSARRARGQRVAWPGEPGPRVTPEPYERRVLVFLLRARQQRADALLEERTPEALRRAAELYRSILKADPGGPQAPGVIFRTGTALYALGQAEGAETAFRELLDLDIAPRERALSLFYLSELAKGKGRAEEAARLRRESLAVPGLDPAFRAELERGTPR
jgi:tetratricopeptide (TPR) repeat protein